METRHRWMRPSVVRVGEVWTARQSCWRCESIQNPITGEILAGGDGLCSTRELHEIPDAEVRAQTARVQTQLQWLKRDGLTVDPHLGDPEEAVHEEVLDRHPAAAGSGY